MALQSYKHESMTEQSFLPGNSKLNSAEAWHECGSSINGASNGDTGLG